MTTINLFFLWVESSLLISISSQNKIFSSFYLFSDKVHQFQNETILNSIKRVILCYQGGKEEKPQGYTVLSVICLFPFPRRPHFSLCCIAPKRPSPCPTAVYVGTHFDRKSPKIVIHVLFKYSVSIYIALCIVLMHTKCVFCIFTPSFPSERKKETFDFGVSSLNDKATPSPFTPLNDSIGPLISRVTVPVQRTLILYSGRRVEGHILSLRWWVDEKT